jgi:uncharacterized heparinase superfamily protein
LNLLRRFNTIKDIPPQQLLARVVFEGKKRSLPRLPLSLRQAITLSGHSNPPSLISNYFSSLHLFDTNLNIFFSEESSINEVVNRYSFTFLNETRTLSLPIVWSSLEYPRLWQFNLHYFDWIRDILDKSYKNRSISSFDLTRIYKVTDDWINSNDIYHLDGWHPYTTSLRIVNWTYAIRAVPQLATPKILQSLWTQFNYLYQNKEYFAGGNHLLENLRGLIICGLNFNSIRAKQIVNKSVEELLAQLNVQILSDGGHYELSPMYHLIMLALVGESVAALKSANWQVPQPILNHLEKMLDFAVNMRLQNGAYPLWNDAAYNISKPLDEVVGFITQLLERTTNYPTNALYEQIIKSTDLIPLCQPKPIIDTLESSHFRSSGYHILRHNSGIELAFDCASPCPREIPPHAHADCLTFDLYYRGKPIIVDTGTSEYAPGIFRNYERSTLAHNTIEINGHNQSEIWSEFRVGRKAQPFDVQYGIEKECEWISASHDGYLQQPLQATHHRWVGLYNESIIIFDQLETLKDTLYISNFHFAPGLEIISNHLDNHEYICNLGNDILYLQVLGLTSEDKLTWNPPDTSQSWYAPEFGKRIPRGKLSIQGSLPTSGKKMCLVISFNTRVLAKMKSDSSFSFLELNSSQNNIISGWQWGINNKKLKTTSIY